MLVNTIGGLLILEAVFMVIPLVTALIYEEKDWEAFAFTAAFTALSGILMRRIPVRSNRMGKHPGWIYSDSVGVDFLFIIRYDTIHNQQYSCKHKFGIL